MVTIITRIGHLTQVRKSGLSVADRPCRMALNFGLLVTVILTSCTNVIECQGKVVAPTSIGTHG